MTTAEWEASRWPTLGKADTMDQPFSPEPASGNESVPLSFNLNQAAALCGVSAQQLREWTDCGYIQVSGHGDRQRYNRDALRQILAVRDAILSGRMAARRSNRRASAAHASSSPGRGTPSSTSRPEARRPEEFSVPKSSMDDDHLAVQAELFFSLNAGAPQTAAQLSNRFDVSANRMERVLESMLHTRRVLRVRCNHEILYYAGRTHLHGPNPREQRIRATRRQRIPTEPR